MSFGASQHNLYGSLLNRDFKVYNGRICAELFSVPLHVQMSIWWPWLCCLRCALVGVQSKVTIAFHALCGIIVGI